MITPKNGGEVSLSMGIGQDTIRAIEGRIDFTTLQNKMVECRVLFTAQNPNWYETKVVTPEVKAVAANPDKGIEAVEAKAAVLDVCHCSKTQPHGYFSLGQFEFDHEGNVLLEAHKFAISKLGAEWEITNLKTV